MTDSVTTTVIAATPGYQVIELMEGGGGLSRTPVIAWRVDVCEQNDMTFVYTRPVTIESDEEDKCRAVLAPDGRVHMGDSVFENIYNWSDDQREQRGKIAEIRKGVEEQMAKVKKP